MATPISLKLFLILISFSLLTPLSTARITFRDLESAIFALRANGYNLFANSIAVSDLSFQVLSLSLSSSTNFSGGFTFLAPPNSALFSLDMSADAFTYVNSLRFHIIPRRLSFSELRNLSRCSSPHLETLVPRREVFVSSSGDVVSIDGVRISFPDMYVRSEIAVHGLDGILVSDYDQFFHGFVPISMPPEIDGIPSPAPEPFGFPVSAPVTSDCGVLSDCDTVYLSPAAFSPFIGSLIESPVPVSESPMIESPEPVSESPMSESPEPVSESPMNESPEPVSESLEPVSESPVSNESEAEESQGQSQSQGEIQSQGEGQLNFAKWSHMTTSL